MGFSNLGTAATSVSSSWGDLSTLGKASIGMQAFGGVMGALGAYDKAAMQRSNLNFNADIADINAGIAEDRAENALRMGQQKVGDLTLKTGQLKGRQRAAMAANGIVVGQGSSGEVLDSTDYMKDVDVLRIQEQAIYDAWGYQTNAGNYRSQAAINRTSASGISPGMSGFSSLIGSSGRVASSWYRMAHRGT